VTDQLLGFSDDVVLVTYVTAAGTRADRNMGPQLQSSHSGLAKRPYSWIAP